MLTSNYTAEIDSRQIHNTYIADSDAYRLLRSAQQSQRSGPDGRGYCLIERIGACLIALGRALCERRGALAVEIAFHAGQGTRDRRTDGRHVA